MHPAQHALLTELLQQWYDEARSGIDDTCYDEIVAIHLARLHTQAAAWQARITATFGVPCPLTLRADQEYLPDG